MTKEELREYHWTRRDITKLEYKLMELDAVASKMTTHLKKDPHSITGQGNTSDKVGNSVADMELIREDMAEQIKKSYAVLAGIEKAIEVLPARERYLIRARYIELLTWEQICVDMGYSWKQTHRIHSDALQLLTKDDTQ